MQGQRRSPPRSQWLGVGIDSSNQDWRRLLDAFGEKVQTVSYKRGDIIPTTDVESCFLVLAEGRIDIVHQAYSGREVLLHELRAGEPFGVFAAISRSHNLVAMAKDDAVVMLSAGPGLASARLEPSFSHALFDHALATFSRLAQRLIEQTTDRAKDRLRLELVREARQHMLDEHTGLLKKPSTHADLATRIGSQREEVSRELSYLKGQGLVQRHRQGLLVRVEEVEALYWHDKA